VSEADICRKLVVPKLLAVGWDTDPHSIAEQRTITDGRIVPAGKGFVRKPPKRVDFLLRYTRDFPLAVVEAKADYKAAADGVQQAKTYAEMLGLKFAYATNGHDIIEIDYTTGLERSVSCYPAPAELWARYRQASGISDAAQADRLLTPCNHAVGKGERYYQQIAINRAVEGALKGDRRMLITMATGTGKTAVAFQICWKTSSRNVSSRVACARAERALMASIVSIYPDYMILMNTRSTCVADFTLRSVLTDWAIMRLPLTQTRRALRG
jgi:type I restriction enzyme, R subunit